MARLRGHSLHSISAVIRYIRCTLASSSFSLRQELEIASVGLVFAAIVAFAAFAVSAASAARIAGSPDFETLSVIAVAAEAALVYFLS